MTEPGVTLVVHPGALGDVLLAIPALRALRSQKPDQSLVLAAQPRLGRLLAALGEVDRAVDFESVGLHGLFTAPPGQARLPLLERAARVVCWFGAREPLFGANLRAIAPDALLAAPAAGDLPVWQHLRRSVGATLGGDTAPLRVPPMVVDAGRRVLRDAGWDGARPVVVLQPGAGSSAKRWPVDGFAAVAGDIGRARPVALAVHEGPADAEAAVALGTAIEPGAIRLREPPLEALAGVLATALLYLGNDSGVSHLAAAVGVPSIVLFTRDLLGWRPWALQAQLVVVSTGRLVASDLERVRASVRAALA